jgi:hypothetical protein
MWIAAIVPFGSNGSWIQGAGSEGCNTCNRGEEWFEC